MMLWGSSPGLLLFICAIFLLFCIVVVPLVRVEPQVLSSSGSLVCLIYSTHLFYLLQVLMFLLRRPDSIHLGRLMLDFASFQPLGRSDCWATDGLLTSLCMPALVLLSVLTGRV